MSSAIAKFVRFSSSGEKRFDALVRTQAASVAGDTLLTVALANSLFFEVDPNGARWRVGLYLLFTIAPFAIVAPLLGPAMDRLKGGHKLTVIVSAAVRAILMIVLIFYVRNLLLFPLAFLILVSSKTHAVAKSSLVPGVIGDQADLVKSNSRLTVSSALVGAVAGAIGVGLLQIFNTQVVLGVGALAFAVCALFAPKIQIMEPTPDSTTEVSQQPGPPSVVVNSTSMGYLRASVGFVTMLLAFSLRGGIDPGPVGPGVELGHRVREALGLERLVLSSGGSPPWHFGVALIGAGLGGLAGAIGVAWLRKRFVEERIISIGLGILTVAGIVAAIISSAVVGAFVIALGVTLASQVGKQAFDSLVQRDLSTVNLGRTFSRFESRFQLVWVLGALIPVVLVLPSQVGYLLVAIGAGLSLIVNLTGRSLVPLSLIEKLPKVRRAKP